jgi:excisionase family DNA binding protein
MSEMKRVVSTTQDSKPQVSAASPYLTTDEAVAYTRTSAKTLRRAELADELPAFKPGKTKLYRVTDLDRWVASKVVRVTRGADWQLPKLSEMLGVAT